MNLVINEKYKLIKKISSGSFGTVYVAQNIQNPANFTKNYAAKLERISQFDTLPREGKLLKFLQGTKGVPKIYFIGVAQ